MEARVGRLEAQQRTQLQQQINKLSAQRELDRLEAKIKAQKKDVAAELRLVAARVRNAFDAGVPDECHVALDVEDDAVEACMPNTYMGGAGGGSAAPARRERASESRCQPRARHARSRASPERRGSSTAI